MRSECEMKEKVKIKVYENERMKVLGDMRRSNEVKRGGCFHDDHSD